MFSKLSKSCAELRWFLFNFSAKLYIKMLSIAINLCKNCAKNNLIFKKILLRYLASNTHPRHRSYNLIHCSFNFLHRICFYVMNSSERNALKWQFSAFQRIFKRTLIIRYQNKRLENQESELKSVKMHLTYWKMALKFECIY